MIKGINVNFLIRYEYVYSEFCFLDQVDQSQILKKKLEEIYIKRVIYDLIKDLRFLRFSFVLFRLIYEIWMNLRLVRRNSEVDSSR